MRGHCRIRTASRDHGVGIVLDSPVHRAEPETVRELVIVLRHRVRTRSARADRGVFRWRTGLRCWSRSTGERTSRCGSSLRCSGCRSRRSPESHHLGPMFALQPHKQFANDTVLIVDGIPGPHPRPHRGRVSKNDQYSTTTRSSSTPTSAWSTWSAGHCLGTAATARHGRSPAPRPLGVGRSRSPTAAIRALASSLTAASVAGSNYRTRRRNATSPAVAARFHQSSVLAAERGE